MLVHLVKEIRVSKGWSGYKMAKALGVSQTQLNYMERQAKSIRTDILIRLWEVSGLDGSEFLERVKAELKTKEHRTRLE
jgi:transcriptional regulator with XRE-family HTH domain